MPVIIAILLQGLLFLVRSFVGRALVALGLSVVTYTGISASIGWLKDNAIGAIGGLPAEWVNLLSYMKVGVCISILFSAMLTRLLVTGLSSDTVKRWVLK